MHIHWRWCHSAIRDHVTMLSSYTLAVVPLCYTWPRDHSEFIYICGGATLLYVTTWPFWVHIHWRWCHSAIRDHVSMLPASPITHPPSCPRAHSPPLPTHPPTPAYLSVSRPAADIVVMVHMASYELGWAVNIVQTREGKRIREGEPVSETLSL